MVYDERWQLFWISARHCKHSRLLAKNPKASIVIYASPGNSHDASALYLSGIVKTCDGVELVDALERYKKRTKLQKLSMHKEDYQEDSPCRMYCFSPHQAFSLQEPEWQENLLIDKRTPVDLPL